MVNVRWMGRVAMLLLCLWPAATGHADWEHVFADEARGIRFAVPEGWSVRRVMDEPSRQNSLLVVLQRRGARITVQSVDVASPDRFDFSEYVLGQAELKERQGMIRQLIRPDTVPVQDVEAMVSLFERRVDDTDVWVMEYSLVGRDHARVVHVTVYSPKDQFDRNETDLHRVLESLALSN